MRTPTKDDLVESSCEAHKPGQSAEVAREGVERAGLDVSEVMEYGLLVADAMLPDLVHALMAGDVNDLRKTLASGASACVETGWRTHARLSKEA